MRYQVFVRRQPELMEKVKKLEEKIENIKKILEEHYGEEISKND